MLAEIYNTFPAEVWIAIGAPIIVVIVNQLKKLLGDKKFDIVIHIMTVTTSFLVTYLPTVLAHSAKPPEFLAAYTAAFFTAANIIYAISKALRAFLVFWRSKEPVETQAPAAPVTEPTPAASSLDRDF